MDSRIVILMGVSGSGKSTVGELLAERTEGSYFDGDDFHPPENVERMRSGTPLTDDHRKAWFAALSDLVKRQLPLGQWTFIACSALKRVHRETLREADEGMRFILLEGSYELIHERMASRADHYMPASLLQSQFESLELPSEDEEIPRVNIATSPEEIAAQCAEILGVG